MKRILTTFILAGALTAASTATAKEETGDVLASLVESVDSKLTNLQSSMEQKTQVQAEVRADLNGLAEQWEEADEPEQKLAIKSEIIKGWSELNANDRLILAQSLDTIVSVVDDLQRLQEVYEEGIMDPKRLEQKDKQVRSTLMNVGPVLYSLSQTIDNPAAKAQLASTEQTAILLYQQLEVTSSSNSEGMLNQIHTTTAALEEVAAQLIMVQDLLEMERYQLEVGSQVSITELLFVRLGDARFGDHDLVSVPQAFTEGVAGRNEAFGEILRSSSLNNPSANRTQTDEGILRKIRLGNLPN